LDLEDFQLDDLPDDSSFIVHHIHNHWFPPLKKPKDFPAEVSLRSFDSWGFSPMAHKYHVEP